MWVNREDYLELKRKLRNTDGLAEDLLKTRSKLGEVRDELRELKRSLMPANHYMVIDMKSGLRYDVYAVDYLSDNSYDGDICTKFRKVDYSVVLSIPGMVSIQVVEEE